MGERAHPRPAHAEALVKRERAFVREHLPDAVHDTLVPALLVAVNTNLDDVWQQALSVPSHIALAPGHTDRVRCNGTKQSASTALATSPDQAEESERTHPAKSDDTR